MHGIDLKTQMDILYHALNDTSKGIIDASCCGAFKRKSAEEDRNLIEDLAKCNKKRYSDVMGIHKRDSFSLCFIYLFIYYLLFFLGST